MNNSSQPKTNKDWEDLAQVDALWAILSDPQKKYGKWEIGDFFKEGEREVSEIIKYLGSKGIGSKFGKILDFGCGAGRLAQSFSGHCREYYGVDVSRSMLKLAEKYNNDCPNCKFLFNEKDDLSIFGDNSFDLIYSNIVLQHIPSKDARRYIAEFVRILKPGGHLYFQLPGHIPFIHRFQPRRHLYTAMRKLGVPSDFLWRKLKLMPIRMMSLPPKEVARIVEDDAEVLEVRFPRDYGTRYLIRKK